MAQFPEGWTLVEGGIPVWTKGLLRVVEYPKQDRAVYSFAFGVTEAGGHAFTISGFAYNAATAALCAEALKP